MITFKIQNPTEAAALIACLGNFLDNEHDKGPEGIGEDLAAVAGDALGGISAGLKSANDDSFTVRLSLMEAALIERALDIHSDGSIDETWEMEGADVAITAMLARLNRGITL